MSGLTLRVITALVVLPGVLALIWVPWLHYGFALFIAVLGGFALHEYFGLAEKRGVAIHPLAGVVVGIIIVVSARLGNPQHLNSALVMGIVLIALVHVINPPPSITGLGTSIGGLVYTAWLPAHILMLHARPEDGAGLVMTLLVAVAVTDTAAYFVGKAIGKRKLAPVVSPKKTWEGAVGGFVFAMIGMAVLYSLRSSLDWTKLPDWSIGRYAVTGALVSVSAQISDLVASSIKRDAGVKDSGRLFPGHGGALDRCDGFLFGAPVLYYMAVF